MAQLEAWGSVLTTGGNLTLTNLIQITGGNDLTLDVTGTVTQSAAISASDLQILGSGAVNLDNSANDVDTIAAQHSGTICYTDSDDLAVGTVTDSAQPSAATPLPKKAMDMNSMIMPWLSV